MAIFEYIKAGVATKTLTNDAVEELVESLISTESDKIDPAQPWEQMKGYKFLSHIIDSSAQIKTFCADDFDRLGGDGFGEFKSDNPSYTMKMIISSIRLSALKTCMEECIQIEHGLRNNITLLIKRFRAETRAYWAFGQEMNQT